MTQKTIPNLCLAVCLVHCLLSAWTWAAEVRFDQTDYFAKVNQPFQVKLIFDADETADGDQLPLGGFFSVGAAILFPSGHAETSVQAVELPPYLNGNGLGEPAPKEATGTRAGAAGAVNVLLGNPPHSNSVFLTITLTNLASSGSYALDSELFLDTPFNNFINARGEPLDSSITRFSSATVHVLLGDPDPLITSLTLESNQQFRISFVDPFGVPPLFQVERNADLGDSDAWEPIPEADISETLPGQFEALFTDQTPARFFRVVALLTSD